MSQDEYNERAGARGLGAAIGAAIVATRGAVLPVLRKIAPKIFKPQAKPGSSGGPGAGKRFSEPTKDAAERAAWGKCEYCKKQTTRSRNPEPSRRNTDHVIPRSRDGNNTRDNAANTCQTCNNQKGTRTAQEFRRDLSKGERLRRDDE